MNDAEVLVNSEYEERCKYSKLNNIKTRILCDCLSDIKSLTT